MKKNNLKEEIYRPCSYEIHADKNGKPYLKKMNRRKDVNKEGRGLWMPIGLAIDYQIEKFIKINKDAGLIVLLDEYGMYRALVLTD